MYLLKQKKTILAILVLLVVLVAAITLTQVIDTANAATTKSYDDLDFKLVTNADGSQSYSVSLKVACRKTAEFVVIPNTYDGLPVTEIAANGFMSCAKLTKVVLPKSIVTIGKNAFMNCASLESIAMTGVETIGDNAFSMCTKLERLYFPLSVKSVGSTILRNNSNTIYLQGSQAEIEKSWSSTWNSYFTGETVENVEPSDMIQYREVMGMDNQTVVGYEIQEYQTLPGGDIVIYNMIKTAEAQEYLPLLNICSEAFTYSVCDSLTIKDIHEYDTSAPVSTHKINLRSNAFLLALIDEINIQVGVMFNHPQGLQQDAQFSMLDDAPITGDANGHSTRVFEESTVQALTLPDDMEIITETMFKNCVYLESIKLNGAEYDGNNVLPNVTFIGTRAFEYCISLENLSIPNSVTYFGHNVFDGWGLYVEHQELNLDFYEGFVPGEYDWNEGINKETVQINYREPTTITIELEDGSGQSISIQVKPGLEMPQLDEITRKGYEFKGIFARQNGDGFQYYTNSLEVARLWQEGDSKTLYVNWKIIYYEIEYDLSEIPFDVDISMNPTKFTVEDGEIIFQTPQMEGYEFRWEPARKPQDTLEAFTTKLHYREQSYNIHYALNGGNSDHGNPGSITVSEVKALKSLTRDGYVFMGWQLDGEFVNTLKNINKEITLTAIWEYVGSQTVVTPSTATTTVSDRKVVVDLTDARYISGCKLIVESSVYELIIYSKTAISYSMSVIVEERDTNITIKLVNVDLHGTDFCDTIILESQVTLYLYATNSAVYGRTGSFGADGSDGIDGFGRTGGIGGAGYVAIRCYNLVINTSVTIYGGTGGIGGAGATGGSSQTPGNGGNGGRGGYAVDAQEIVVLADGVKLVGGNGGNGGRGAVDSTGTKSSAGGIGGAGSVATNANIVSTCDFELINGEQGADGPKGSWGPVASGLYEKNN